MKYVDEYRDRAAALKLAAALAVEATRPCTIMEVCGGQTHSIMRYGLDQLLPANVELLHGPGCPVCVTPVEIIDRAQAIARERDVIFCSFGDMLRVPGSQTDLLRVKAAGGDVRIVYSPLDAVMLAKKHPDRRVVFFAIGFETTAPANATAVLLARKLGLENFYVLVSHVLVPPMLAAIMQAPENRVEAFLGPGHVCSIAGTVAYEAIASRYRVPIAVAGFEPVDLLEAVLGCVRQLARGESKVELTYARAVSREGNLAAQRTIAGVFEVCDRAWRGIGWIPKSGYKLSWEYAAFDAERHFDVAGIVTNESPVCISGQVLRGLKKPPECPAFGKTCTPESPLGATMVSQEGACAAYLAYGRDASDGKRRLDGPRG